MDKLREKLYKEMESWVSDLVTDSDLPKRELLSAYAYEYCIKDEIIDFFPEAKRKVFRKILDASRRFEARSKQALTELLEDPAFDEKIDQALNQLTILSSVSPESPESIPTP